MINKFLKFNQAGGKLGKAPHKIVLILTILDFIREGIVTDNKFYLSDEFVVSFHSNWDKFVRSKHIPNIAYPFYHLKNDRYSKDIWILHLINSDNSNFNSRSYRPSITKLRKNVIYASLNKSFFEWLSNFNNLNQYRDLLISDNFGLTTTQEVVAENQGEYLPMKNMAVLVERKKKIKREYWEENVLVRSNKFPKAIKQIYNNTCAVTGLKVEISGINPLLEACHIKPFSEDYQDVIVNGIAMSPTFHTAFDKGLFTVNDSYEIKVSNSVLQNIASEDIWNKENKMIILPENNDYFPAIEYLDWHRREVFITL